MAGCGMWEPLCWSRQARASWCCEPALCCPTSAALVAAPPRLSWVARTACGCYRTVFVVGCLSHRLSRHQRGTCLPQDARHVCFGRCPPFLCCVESNPGVAPSVHEVSGCWGPWANSWVAVVCITTCRCWPAVWLVVCFTVLAACGLNEWCVVWLQWTGGAAAWLRFVRASCSFVERACRSACYVACAWSATLDSGCRCASVSSRPPLHCCAVSCWAWQQQLGCRTWCLSTRRECVPRGMCVNESGSFCCSVTHARQCACWQQARVPPRRTPAVPC
jgi:hypothetical protein